MSEQAVNPPTDVEPSQVSTDEDVAQEPDLASLLAEFDQPETPEVAEPAAKEAPQVDSEITSFVQRQMQKETEQALAESARTLREVVGETDLSEDWFEAHLYRAGAKDPRITQAFNERDANPGRWKSILKSLGNELKADRVKTDKPSTDSWNAVEASVHSSSTTTPQTEQPIDAKTLRGMSDQEFAALQQKMGFKR